VADRKGDEQDVQTVSFTLKAPLGDLTIPADAIRLVSGTGGTVYYQDRNGSPCTGDPSWIGCNPNTPGDRTGFAVYLRVFPTEADLQRPDCRLRMPPLQDAKKIELKGKYKVALDAR
jgi:hypothetical protein